MGKLSGMPAFSLNKESNKVMNEFIMVYQDLCNQYSSSSANDVLISRLVDIGAVNSSDIIYERFRNKERAKYNVLSLEEERDEDHSSHNLENDDDSFEDVLNEQVTDYAREVIFCEENIEYIIILYGVNLIKKLSNYNKATVPVQEFDGKTSAEFIIELLENSGLSIEDIDKISFANMIMKESYKYMANNFVGFDKTFDQFVQDFNLKAVV